MGRKTKKTTQIPNIKTELARLRDDFFARFLAGIKMPAIENFNPPAVCWIDPHGHINHFRLLSYMQPHAGVADRPFIPRICLNHYQLDHSEQISLQLGQHLRPYSFDERLRWSFELSLLPRELPDFASWIISLADAHAANDSSLLIPPPHRCHFWSKPIFECNYAWTAAAWRKMSAYQAKHRKGLRGTSLFLESQGEGSLFGASRRKDYPSHLEI